VSGPGTVHYLFDLDDTLYPASNGFFALISARIRTYIQQTLGFDERAARVIQRRYWRRYGTSLRGLMVRHGVEPAPFLEFVHDVPVESHVFGDPRLREALVALEGRRHVFTNGPDFYARRVLARLGVGDLFDRVFDIASFGYVPKPNAEPYDCVTRALGGPEARFVLVDDAPANLEPARARGWTTVWLRSPESWLGGTRGLTPDRDSAPAADAVIERITDLPGVLRQVPMPTPPTTDGFRITNREESEAPPR
jgi:putative hydrolase of the HAD superfamily